MNIQKIEFFKIKLSHELPSKLNYLLSKTYKKSHSTTRTIIAFKKFVFHPNNMPLPSSGLSYRESTVANPISFH